MKEETNIGVQAPLLHGDSTPKQRVQTELNDLKDKIVKLTEFLYGENIIESNISRDMVNYMEEQLKFMQAYACMLQNRLAIWDRQDKVEFQHHIRIYN